MTLAAGDLVDGRYRVLRPIGEGGMGTVYLAENVRIDRKVAIKVLHGHLANMDDVVVRFEREARAAARIGSPHIADVIDLGVLPSGERFVIMEYLAGESLEARLRAAGRIAAADMAPIALQLLTGLSEVHAAGIIHRDLKPGNIFLCTGKDREIVKILDFGVSKFRTGLFNGPDAVSTAHDMLGTPTYMAPEHVSGDAVDARADVYSVGAVLYRCVSGMRPYTSENYLELLVKIVEEPPRPLEALAPGVDPGFCAIVKKAMARCTGDRYQTAAEFREAIATWVTRIDRLLAEFLGLHHAAAARIRTPTGLLGSPQLDEEAAPRAPLVSKIVFEPEDVPHSTPEPTTRELRGARTPRVLAELAPGTREHRPSRDTTVVAPTDSYPPRAGQRVMFAAILLTLGAVLGFAAVYAAHHGHEWAARAAAIGHSPQPASAPPSASVSVPSFVVPPGGSAAPSATPDQNHAKRDAADRHDPPPAVRRRPAPATTR